MSTPSTPVSGTIIDQDDKPLSTVRVALVGSGDFVGQDYTAVTNGSGDWLAQMPVDWTGYISASKDNYTFDPGYIIIDLSTDDWDGNDFTGTVTTNFIKLVRSVSSGVPARTQAYRMVATVTEYEGISPDIFLYARRTLEPKTETTGDVFISVCGPSDIEEFPVGEPDPLADLPYYRLSQIDLLFRSAETMEETWTAILSDIRNLGEAMTQINKLEVQEETVVTF